MKSHLRGLALLICALSIVLLGGASTLRASPTPSTYCNSPAPSGRLFCATVDDVDGVSPSGHVGSGIRQADVEAYQFYKVTIANMGGSSLTNGTMSVVLTDNFPGGAKATSTALYVPSPGAPTCAVVSTTPNRVDCTLGNLGANTSTPTIVLAYRTSTSPDVTSTDAAATVGFKEGSNGPNGANPATLSFVENTSLEPDPEGSVGWSPPGHHVALSTSPTFDSQFTSLQYNVPAGKPAFTATMNESLGQVCAPSVQCFGELVTTDLHAAALGTFSADSPFHLQLTLDLALLPGGNTKGVVLSHRLDNGDFEVVSRKCSASPPAPGEALPCLTVTVVTEKKAKLLVIDAWGIQNGGWHPGLE